MARFSIQPVLALLGALTLLCLAGCAPTTTASVQPTATATPSPTPMPTATPTLVPAPTPTNVPAGWLVLDTPHFSLAYPSGWTSDNYSQQDGSVVYQVTPPSPSPQTPAVRVILQEDVPTSDVGNPYCMPTSSDISHVTLVGLPMTYMLSGEGLLDRTWTFANAQRTVFVLAVGDAQSGATTQAQDDAILATFRPDNAAPWSC